MATRAWRTWPGAGLLADLYGVALFGPSAGSWVWSFAALYVATFLAFPSPTLDSGVGLCSLGCLHGHHFCFEPLSSLHASQWHWRDTLQRTY